MRVLHDTDFDVRKLECLECAPSWIVECLLSIPGFPGAEYCDADMLLDLWKRAKRAFLDKFSVFEGTLVDFIKSLAPKIEIPGRVYFHLVEKKGSEDPFAFLATYSTREKASNTIKHVPLQHALLEFRENQEKLLHLLSCVHKVAVKSALIADLVDGGDIFYPLGFSSKEAYTFLTEVLEYEKSGVLCRIPDWWRPKTHKIGLSVAIGGKKPAHVGFSALLDARPALLIDGVEISIEEARRLLGESEGLVMIKNKWVAVDPGKLQAVLDAYEQLAPDLEAGMSLSDALRMQLKLQKADEQDEAIIEVTSGQWLRQVMESLRTPAVIEPVVPSDDFSACLRPYQEAGLNWLHTLYQLGFGGCLADDMGLGKTIQLLAFLGLVRPTQPGPSLLVIPASLLANWRQEINRFLPTLNVYYAHPGMENPGASKHLAIAETLPEYDLVITTYALAQRYEWLNSHAWNCVILDEAQAVKNPSTKQSKAIKKLNARVRFALTGTPLENSLSDLWSLFDFLNPGLLGSAGEFKAYAKSLTEHPEAYGSLRKVISPFILRRSKTDKQIISDLPDKVEVKTYAELSKQQVVLYRQMQADLEEKLEQLDGINRRGLILSVLMKCKQLCNHPSQYLGSGGYAEAESGKFRRLRELCETIYEKRERALIFTQFKEITQPLHDYLSTIFAHPGRILHGSVAVHKRQQLVSEFQDPRHYVPFMVLSIKAGGVGLNLTQANHVIHFDRWWNPAVENQATDRAFRIGQQKDVL
ncbi:MAG: DEAD/DEAH box helicase, partial [Spartobacteria bacterium]|nr:DEAD/DEAH box helicase [Spartobacteria bacterium]